MAKGIKYFTLWFCGICIAIFLIQTIVPRFTDSFMLTPNAISMPWQFLTAVFLHGSITHLFYNLFALFLFGLMLEGIIGSKKFLWLFMLSGIFANMVSFYWYPNALGASGAIMAVIGCLAVLRPGMTVWAFNLPMPMFIAAILWVGAGILGIFGFGDQGTGHLAHVSGIFIGVLYGFYLRYKYPQSKPGFSQTQRIIIQEGAMRRWEDSNLR